MRKRRPPPGRRPHSYGDPDPPRAAESATAGGDDSVTTPTIRLWIDPTCPWAWQTSKWTRGLRDEGLVELEWSLFSLELQAMPDVPFDEAARRGGDALRSLALARSKLGAAEFERLYVAMGSHVHDQGERVSGDVVRAAAAEAGLVQVVVDATSDDRWADEVTTEFSEAHRSGVFGVPTISIDGTKPMFGPVFAVAPSGDDSRTLLGHVRWLAERPDFFELKRLRDRKPGAGA
jgi:predicted DsbA family dithiol-disulfide isomerase